MRTPSTRAVTRRRRLTLAATNTTTSPFTAITSDAGDLDRPLHRVRSDQQPTEQQRRRDRQQRVQPAEQGRNDAVESRRAGESGRRAVGHESMTLAAEHEHGTGQAAHRAAGREGQRRHPFDGDAGVAGRIGVGPGGTQPVTGGGAPQEHPRSDRGHQSNHDTEVQPGAVEQHRKVGVG